MDYFHIFLSSFIGDTNDLELGDEVEYTLARKSSKVSAENIRKLATGTIPADVSGQFDIYIYIYIYI